MRKSIAMIAILAMSGPALAEPLSGTWLTADGSTQVRFAPCGERGCGQITWLREPNDPETGRAWRDKFNPDDTLKRRPLIGLAMVSGLKETAAGRWEGELYNPLDGKTYSGSFRTISADKIELKGCALAGLICQSETWTRVAP